MEPLPSEHVSKILDQLGIETIQFEESTATSQMAADAIGCELGQIAKSLAFVVNGTPILVVASGDQRVDDRKLAALYEVGRKKVKTAKPDQCIEIYGYAPGGVPPFGHRTPDIPIYIDESLLRFEVVYAAAGSAHANFPITVQQLIEVTGGKVMDVKRD